MSSENKSDHFFPSLMLQDFLHSERRIVPQSGGIKAAEKGAKQEQEDSFLQSSVLYVKFFGGAKVHMGEVVGKLQILHGPRRMEQETNKCSFTRLFRTALRTFSIQFHSSRTWCQGGRRTKMTTLLSFSAPHFLLSTSPPAPFSPTGRREQQKFLKSKACSGRGSLKFFICTETTQ